MPRPKPRTLRPLTKEQKRWLILTIILFVLFAAVGWSFTVARALKRSVTASREQFSSQLTQTQKHLWGDQTLADKTQESLNNTKTFFENLMQDVKNKQRAEQAILQNVKQQVEKSSP